MKRTKIVSTIGPATEKEEVLRKLFLGGLNVARLNFSHGTHEEHKDKMDKIKRLRKEMDLPIAIMLDTKGPEIRLKNFKNGQAILNDGETFTLTIRDIEGDESIASVTYEGLAADVKLADRILIDDGLVELVVEDIINETDIICRVLNGGMIKDHKGINVPNVQINLPAVMNTDIDDIRFGIENDIDFVAASFIRKADDVLDIRKVLEDNGGDQIDIISKIENQQGVDNIDEIIEASDGIMVARGDLGVEIEPEEIPLIQKKIIRKCNIAGKPVITATQMLDSMIRNPRPTRAEVTDVANAILDGTDAIMLSGETAAGKYPVEAVNTMQDIAIRTEKSNEYIEALKNKRTLDEKVSTTNAISKATCRTAESLKAAAIITATSSGYTAKAVSKFRPRAPIIAATTDEKVMRRLAVVWGVYPVMSAKSEDTDEVIDISIQSAKKKGYVEEGDLIIITAGIPVGVTGTTNLLKVHVIGKMLLKGTGIGNKGSVCGKVTIGNQANDFKNKFKDGDILVSKCTDKDMIEYMERASAIITEEGGLTSHAAIVGLNFGKPTIVGAQDATIVLNDKDIVTVDTTTGLVYKGEARVL